MAEITMQQAQRLSTLLSGAIKGMSYYPAGHPSVLNPMRDIMKLASELLLARANIRMGVHDGVFFVEKAMFFTPQTSIEDLADRFARKKIAQIILYRGLNQAHLDVLVELLADQGADAAQMGKVLLQRGITSILVNAETAVEADEVEAEPVTSTLQAYDEALEAIRDVFRDMENGRIPNSDKIVMVVTNLATLTMQDPAALLGLAMIKDYDNYTFNHSVNVGVLAMALAASLGMNKEKIEDIGVAGFLHDIGKTKLEKRILNKPGKLSATEMEQMKRHSEDGSKIIAAMTGINPLIAQAVLGHHIHHNRKGYPDWARTLPFDNMSDIIAVADCYDAITTLRVYQQPMNPKSAIDRVLSLAGEELDTKLVAAFVGMMGKYPVGTLVRLDTNEIAVVIRPNPGNTDAPIVKIVTDPEGNKHDIPPVQKLGDETGWHYARIVDVVDPLVRNIEVSAYLN